MKGPAVLIPLHLPQDLWPAAATAGYAVLAVAAPAAYLLLAGLDLQNAAEALRAKASCMRPLLKALAHAVLLLKLLLL